LPASCRPLVSRLSPFAIELPLLVTACRKNAIDGGLISVKSSLKFYLLTLIDV
jgi:hypothetical protein